MKLSQLSLSDIEIVIQAKQKEFDETEQFCKLGGFLSAVEINDLDKINDEIVKLQNEKRKRISTIEYE